MSVAISKKALIGLLGLIIVFWETISVFGSHGEFSNFHFEANSERLVLVVPVLLLIWLGRHLLPQQISKSLRGNRRN